MKKHIHFCCASTSLNTASHRIRVRSLLYYLRLYSSHTYTFSTEPIKCDVLILSKKYLPPTSLARYRVQYPSTRVILDICDYHFHDPSIPLSISNSFLDCLKNCDCLTTSTDQLAAFSRDLVSTVPVYTVPDLIGEALPYSVSNFLNKKNLNLLKDLYTLAIHPPFFSSSNHSFLWFGQSVGSHPQSGLHELQRLIPNLNILASDYSFNLNVVSNNRSLANEYLLHSSFPVTYFDWSPLTLQLVMHLSHTVLIPLTPNKFNLSKSPNRLFTSLLNSLQCIADPIPSYQPFTSHFYSGDWLQSLRSILDGERKTPFSQHHALDYNLTVIRTFLDVLSSF